jgi:YspA, cpYpsA-related SLOG family
LLKVIVAGGREFNDYSLLEQKLIRFLHPKYKPSDVEIVSGGARGADKLGERFAKEKGCHLKVMNAEWDKYGKSAGYRRNAEMAKYADACVIFWDGASLGTKHMIDLANREGIPLRIIRYGD